MRITRGVQKGRNGRRWHDWATSSKWPFGQNTTIRSFIYLHPTGRLARPPLHVMGPSPNQVPSKWSWASVPQEVASPRPDALLCLSLDVCRALDHCNSQARPSKATSLPFRMPGFLTRGNHYHLSSSWMRLGAEASSHSWAYLHTAPLLSSKRRLLWSPPT